MSDHNKTVDELEKGARDIRKLLKGYGDLFIERKPALQNAGILGDFSYEMHVVNEWLFELSNRLSVIEEALGIMKGEDEAR